MDCSLPGSFIHGILQARVLEWVAIPSSKGIFVTQGSNLGLLHCRRILLRNSFEELDSFEERHPLLNLLVFQRSSLMRLNKETNYHVRESAKQVRIVDA